jgi:hypothetical protein
MPTCNHDVFIILSHTISQPSLRLLFMTTGLSLLATIDKRQDAEERRDIGQFISCRLYRGVFFRTLRQPCMFASYPEPTRAHLRAGLYNLT